MKLGARHLQEREEAYETSLADMKEKKQRLSTLKIEAAQLEKDFKEIAARVEVVSDPTPLQVAEDKRIELANAEMEADLKALTAKDEKIAAHKKHFKFETRRIVPNPM